MLKAETHYVDKTVEDPTIQWVGKIAEVPQIVYEERLTEVPETLMQYPERIEDEEGASEAT